MSILVWVSLAVFLLAIAAAAVVAVRRGLRTFRAARDFQRELDGTLTPVLTGAAAIEGRAAAVSEAQVRLERSVAGLRRSIAGISYMNGQRRDARLLLRLIRFVRS
jgi:hypothetical protein